MKNLKFDIVDDPIENGYYIYNIHSNDIDKCILITDDGMMCVEFINGNRSIFSTIHYKKAILKK